CPRAGRRVRGDDGTAAPLRVVRRGGGALRGARERPHRPRRDQAGRPRLLPRDPGGGRLPAGRRDRRQHAGRRRAYRACGADLRDAPGVAEAAAARAPARGPAAPGASLLKYPTYMTFFSTPEKLEIGGVPFTTAGDKATRREALGYYRKVAEFYALDVRLYHVVTAFERVPLGFELTVRGAAHGAPARVRARNVVFATGYFDSPNPLGVPGEDLPHVSHFFTEAHPYWRQSVVVVGGGNSAVEAALELH